MNILVTGVGGDIGSGIGRILRDSSLATKVIGCDIHDQHAGRLIFDRCELVSRADDGGYLDTLVNIATKHRVDAIVPTSEPELRFLASEGMSTMIDGIPLIMANEEALRIGFDKLETAEFLRSRNFPFPWTSSVATHEPEEIPCIMKSRFGAGGHDIRIVEDANTISALKKIFTNHIWQELVGTADDEYTCGVYRSSSGNSRVIAFRRRLSAGITSYGVVVDNPKINQICNAIAEEIGLVGSINIQLRLTSRGPVVFEINPRFSSTVVFRHKLGFEDVIWSIGDRLNRPLPAYDSRAKPGVVVLRIFDEVIL